MSFLVKVKSIKYFWRGCGITDAENGYTVDAISRTINVLGLKIEAKISIIRRRKSDND
jgi:hypothetical protein